jgi:uncharacterized repeat protein (TIGR02543 family)
MTKTLLSTEEVCLSAKSIPSIDSNPILSKIKLLNSRLKWLVLALFLFNGVVNVLGQTTTLDFDTDGDWTAVSVAITGYGNHTYAKSNWSFQGANILRNGTTAQDGFAGALGTYSWRLRDAASTSLTATFNSSATISSFGFDVRRWDNAPDPNFTVEYTVNSGSNWTNTGTTINNTYLGSSNWKTYTFPLPSATAVTSGQFRIRIVRSSGERIFIDNFQWTVAPAITNYSVTFNGNGSTSGTMSNQTASSPTNLTTNAFTRTGYTFAGWNTAANGSGTSYLNGASFPFTANATLYAQWTANNLTVTYDTQGGSSVSNGTTTTGGSISSSPGTPTRAGYIFNGWFTTSSGGSAISFPYAHGQTANFTLYAQWTANTLTVTYDSQGGSAVSNGSTTTGGTVSNPGNPVQAGYTFNGWFVAASGGTTISFPYMHGQTVDFTLYAQWTLASSPSISGAAMASAFTTTYGTASAPQSFSITGSALTNDIIATAPTGFEVSSDNSTYGSTATYTQSGGSASGTLYVRLAASAAVSGSYNNQNIALTSTGASTVNITTAASGNTVTAKGLTITGISISNKIYDGNTTATITGTDVYSGLVNGESFSVTGTPSAVFNDKNVGIGKPITISGYTAPSANYTLAQPTGLQANITAATLTVTGVAVISKPYDGTTIASLTGSLSGVVSGDAVTLNGTGTFASVNVGTGISVTSTSSLSGSDAGNYTLTQPIGLTGDITQATQTITFASLTPATLSTADYSPGATASSGLTVSYTSSNPCVATIVGGNIHIVGAGTTTITASQSGGGNYSAASSVNQTLTVMNPTSTLAAGDVALVAINSANPDKFSLVFLKDVAANVAINFTDNGFTATTTTRTGEGFLTYTVPSGGHAAGTVITWTNGMTITGTGWSSAAPTNFSFNGSGDQLFIFSGNTANWSSLSGITLLYGLNYGIALSSTSAAANTVQPSTTLLPATSWLNLATSSYANTYFSNATTSNSTVSVSGTASTLLSYLVDGTNKWFGNSSAAATFPTYTITVSPTPTISSSGTLSTVNTTYGTASVSPTSFSVSASNLTQDLSLTAPSGFEISSGSGYSTSLTISPNSCGAIAATTIDVRLAASTAVGTYSGNIALSSTGATTVNVATVSSTVSTKTLTITNLSASDKLYDGLTTVSVSGTPAYSGLVNSESFSVSGTVSWAFPNATVENNKTLTRTGNYAAPSANYTVTQPSLTASITTRSLTITANNVNKPFGDVLTGGSGSTAFTSSGLQNGETIGSVTIDYGNGAGASDAVGTYSGQVTPSAATGGTYTASNYSISYVAGDIIVSDVPTLDAVTLTSTLTSTYGTASTGVSFTASGSNLSANITATAQSGYEVSSDNSIFSSSVSVSSGATVYVRFSATLAAGSYNNATSVVLSSTGATSTNVTTSSAGNTVSVKGLTITGISISNKTYDGNTTATISGTAAYSGLVNGESFSVSGTPSATFSDKNVGNGKSVLVSGYTAPSVNYSITQPTGLTANITAKELTVTSAAVTTKTYDGTTSATITGTLVGVIFGDIVSLVGTGTFASANVGTGINVTSTSTLTGADAGNYSLTQPTGLTGEITKANQTITFGALANKTTADVPFNLTATASSGLTVSYTSSNTAVATIVGNTVTIVGVGTTNITATQSGNNNYNAAADVIQPLTVTLPDVEEIIFPQYIQGVNGTNANRIPSAYYLKINNLTSNTTYRFYCGLVLSSDLSTSSGAGNNIFVNYTGGAFTRATGTSMSTTGQFSTLTTDANGSYTGWFIIEPTGNATRYVPGNNLFFRITLNDGNNGTTATNYRTTANSTKVINLVASAGANNGTGLYGNSYAGSKNFAVLYDNVNGTGRPVSASFIEDDGSANTTANSYSSFYNTSVNSVAGAFGVVIPNNNSNGIKRIEFKKLSDNSLIYAVTDNDAIWAGTANTVNPIGGTTAISLPHSMFDDAIFNENAGMSLTQNTTVNGTLSLLNGTLNVGSNTLSINGTITRTSGNISASNASSTVVFGGSSAQSIPASTFTGNINNLTLNNNAGLISNQDLTIATNLNLSNGKLDVLGNILTIGTSSNVGTISGTFGSNSYIVAVDNGTQIGKLRRCVNSTANTDYVFPIGDASNYTPLTYTNVSGTAASGAYLDVHTKGTKIPQLNAAIVDYVNRYWEVSPTGITSPNYNISYTYASSDAVGAQTSLVPVKYSNNMWYKPANTLFASGVSQGTQNATVNNTLSWAGLTTFSMFSAAGDQASPLPIELVAFQANCAGDEKINVTWTTASEHNTSHYVVEKSRDGIEWSVLGQTAAAGNSTQLLNYEMIDSEKANGTTYYRLTQFDNDGKYEVFNPVSVNCNGTTSNNHISTYPNPSDESFYVSLFTETMEGNGQLTITDASGRPVYSTSVNIQDGNNVFHIGDLNAAPGMYYIQVSNGTTTTHIVKHSLR